MIIYKTINLKNNKYYIGQDKKNNPEYLGSGLLLNRAIKKYGRENFTKEILCECKTKKELNDMEIYWIKISNSISPNGYNISTGGEGGDNFTNNPNKEIIRKKCISSANKISKQNSLRNKGENNPFFNKKHSKKTRKKMSISKKGKKVWNKGLKNCFSKETLNKMSSSQKGKSYEEKYGKDRSIIIKNKFKKSMMGKYKKSNPKIIGVLNPAKRSDVRKKISTAKENNDKYKILCTYCFREFTKQNYIKSHGEKCKCKKI